MSNSNLQQKEIGKNTGVPTNNQYGFYDPTTNVFYVVSVDTLGNDS
jgi:hypothetical protein